MLKNGTGENACPIFLSPKPFPFRPADPVEEIDGNAYFLPRVASFPLSDQGEEGEVLRRFTEDSERNHLGDRDPY
jgi:hypothetical protein